MEATFSKPLKGGFGQFADRKCITYLELKFVQAGRSFLNTSLVVRWIVDLTLAYSLARKLRALFVVAVEVVAFVIVAFPIPPSVVVVVVHADQRKPCLCQQRSPT